MTVDTPEQLYQAWRKAKLKPLYVRFIDACRMFCIVMNGDLDMED